MNHAIGKLGAIAYQIHPEAAKLLLSFQVEREVAQELDLPRERPKFEVWSSAAPLSLVKRAHGTVATHGEL
jgi:hypothetical protein